MRSWRRRRCGGAALGISLSLFISLTLFLLARLPCVPRRSRRAPLSRLQAAGGTGVAPPPPAVLKFGLNHITTLIENKKAKLVVIASDVSPVELVVWLPALCRKFGVPYAVVNNKGRLGALVHMKTATALALTAYNKEDEAAFGKIVDLANAKFKDNADVRRKWGGGIMGMKTQKRLEIRERLLQCVRARPEPRAHRHAPPRAAPRLRAAVPLPRAFAARPPAPAGPSSRRSCCCKEDRKRKTERYCRASTPPGAQILPRRSAARSLFEVAGGRGKAGALPAVAAGHAITLTRGSIFACRPCRCSCVVEVLP